MENVANMRAYFDNAQLPIAVQLSKCETVTNVKEFVNSHLAFIETYWGKDIAKPYYNRLRQLKIMIEQTSK